MLGANRGTGGWFPTETVAFHRPRACFPGGGRLFSGSCNRRNAAQSSATRNRFAIRGGVCYSLKVADEQWSLPVAVWPARRGKWEAGSLGQVRQERPNS